MDANSAILADGNPGSTARFLWPSGAQNTGVNVSIQGSWGTGIVPSCIALLNCSLPAGTLITFALQRAGDSGYPYQVTTQRLMQNPRGEKLALFPFAPGLTPIIGSQWKANNDVFGTASIAAGATVDWGELWIAPGMDLSVQSGFNVEYDDPTVMNEAELFQGFEQRRTPRRLLTITPFHLAQPDVFQGGSVNPMDFEQLLAQIDRGQRTLIIERYTDFSGAYSAALAHRTAVFGRLGKNAAVKHLTGNKWYQPAELLFKEIPIPV
ncbi:MAG: hypothetical protein E6K53_16105 [Gammaproteobacteria bacterium]|nr:MAG: hypothetical protein E6K53_16105 [Gammaproteobacteria bacterium]